MLVLSPPTYRRTRRIKRAKALTLVAATLTQGIGYSLNLTFDRAVSIAAIDVTAFLVDSGPAGNLFRGSGFATLISSRQVQVPLTAYAVSSGPQVLLTASAGTRIVAGDGGMWAGATGLALPLV